MLLIGHRLEIYIKAAKDYTHDGIQGDSIVWPINIRTFDYARDITVEQI